MQPRIIVAAGFFLLATQSLSVAALAGPGASTVTAPVATGHKANDAPPQLTGRIKIIVKVCFTVEADGSVSDAWVEKIHFYPAGGMSKPGPKIKRELEKSALHKIQKWKYFPRRINGKAVSTPGVCQVMSFWS